MPCIARVCVSSCVLSTMRDVRAHDIPCIAQVDKSKNKELRELFAGGFGMHNAGMLRSDRTLVEKARIYR